MTVGSSAVLRTNSPTEGACSAETLTTGLHLVTAAASTPSTPSAASLLLQRANDSALWLGSPLALSFASPVALSLHGVPMAHPASAQLPAPPPVSVSAVLQTMEVWADRRTVSAVWMPRDEWGSPAVSEHGYHAVLAVRGEGGRYAQAECGPPWQDTGGEPAKGGHDTGGEPPRVGVCALEVPSDWFGSGGAATASVRLESDGSLPWEVTIGNVRLHSPPGWFPLRQAGLADPNRPLSSLPPGIPPASVFATLPLSPVWNGVPPSGHGFDSPPASAEPFSALLYGATGGQPLHSWRVKLHFDTHLFTWEGADVAPAFKPPVVTQSVDGVSFASAGLACGTACSPAQLLSATGAAVPILSVRLRPRSGVDASSRLRLFPFAFELRSYGGGYIVDRQRGPVLGAQGAADEGSVALRPAAVAGVLAYAALNDGTPARVLPNTARLTGKPANYTVRALAVSDDTGGGQRLARVPADGASRCRVLRAIAPQEESGMAAESEVAAEAVLGAWADCLLSLGLAQRRGARRVQMRMERQALHAEFSFGVWAPARVEVRLSDHTLDRVIPVGGEHPCCGPACGGLFQSAGVSAVADGWDVTPLVTFSSSAPHVASVDGGRVRGYSVGAATIRLHAAAPEEETASLSVTDASPVHAVALLPRLVAPGAEWAVESTSKGSWHGEARLETSLRAEGAEAVLFGSVRWSDGAEEPAGPAFAVATASPDLELFPPNGTALPPTGWRVRVAVGASGGCASLDVNWTRCGALVARGVAPVALALPTPVGATLRLDSGRVAPPDDDASLLGLPAALAVRVTVSYRDEATGVLSSRDFTGDSRVSLTLHPPQGCARVN